MMLSFRKIIRQIDFNKEDLAQMESLRNLYLTHIGPTLPVQLNYDPENNLRSAHRLSEHSFQPTSWNIGEGLLSYSARETVADICAYQLERFGRWTGNGYKQDPVNLVLEYLKSWLTTMSVMAPVEDNLRTIMAHSNFVNAIQYAGIFKPGVFNDATMAATLLRIRRHFEEEIIPRVRAEISNASAREHMQHFVGHSTNLSHNLVQFLVYALRKEEAPINLGLRNLRHPETPKMIAVTNTLSGQCLVRLIKTQAVTQLLEDNAAPSFSTGSVLDPSSLKRNPFVDDNMQLIIPQDISLEAGLTKITDFGKHSNSGIEPHFMKDGGQLVTEFLRLHEALFQYAELVNLFQRMYRLAGLGGDLLVYGIMQQVVIQILKCADILSVHMESLFKTVSGRAEAYSGALTIGNNRAEWLENYRTAQPVGVRIAEGFTQLKKDISDMRNVVEQYNLPAALKDAKEEVLLLSSAAETYSNNLARALNEPELNFISPLTTLTAMAPPLPIACSSSSSSTGYDTVHQPLERIGLHKPYLPLADVGPQSGQPDPEIIMLSGYGLTNEIGGILVNLIDRNPGAKYVELQKNNLSAEGLFEFFCKLRRHPGIIGVNLWQNNIGDHGMSAISAAVFDSKLQQLDLNQNGITDHGVELFSVCLPLNKALTFLDLGYQDKGFGDKGLVFLLDGIRGQKTPKITNLRLGGNGFTDKGGNLLLKFLKEHPRVTDIDFDNNDGVSTSLVNKIYAQAAINKSKAAASTSVPSSSRDSFFPPLASSSESSASPQFAARGPRR